MNRETEDKIDSILIAEVNRLYEKASMRGLDIDDMRCLEILYKIKKEAKKDLPVNPLSSPDVPDNLIDLLRAAKGSPSDFE